VEQIHGGNAGNRALGLQHLHEQGVGILNASDGCQFGHSLFIGRSTGRGLEVDGIAEDGGQHQAGNLGLNGNAFQIIEDLEHGAGAADRHVAEENRLVGGDIADLVMVNNGHNLASRKVIRSLGQIAVINQGNLLAGGVGHDLGGGKAKLLENRLCLGIQFALHNRDIIFALGFHQLGIGDGGGDRIGIRTFVTKNINRHSVLPPRT